MYIDCFACPLRGACRYTYAYAIFHELSLLDKRAVRGFAFVVNNSTMSPTDHGATNPNTGTNAGQLTEIRQTDRVLGHRCLPELQKALLKIDSLSGASTTNNVNHLGEYLHQDLDIDVAQGSGQEKSPTVDQTTQNPSGGAVRSIRNNRCPVSYVVPVSNVCWCYCMTH
uniref:Uncharacterized protein n=1 Tax=Octactis speculum TaxID=3111310 RepID=A0A7S2FSL8_9STRA